MHPVATTRSLTFMENIDKITSFQKITANNWLKMLSLLRFWTRVILGGSIHRMEPEEALACNL